MTDPGYQDLADRVALRALVDAYARHVDRRDTNAVAALFSAEGRLVSHVHSGGPPAERVGRTQIAAALVEGLARYLATTHLVGGQVAELHGDRATGETTCLAHHVYEHRGERRLLVLAVRYDDEFAREGGAWYFTRRELRLDWRDDRPSAER